MEGYVSGRSPGGPPPGAAFPVEGEKFGVALAWDPSNCSSRVDLDLQAIAFDVSGKLLEAVYFNNLKALRGSLTHSGDETTGEKAGYNEVVWANLRRLPESVKLVAFVVGCHSGGNIREACNATLHVLQDIKSQTVASFQLGNHDAQVAFVGALVCEPSEGWTFRIMEESGRDGQHFMDILEPTIGSFVRQIIPGAPKRIKAAFAMEKGSSVDLPHTSSLKGVMVGLSWDASEGNIDLDVSVLLFDSRLMLVDKVNFQNLEAEGVKHSGDNRTGAGDGDDETITVDLEAVAADVQQMVFLINIFERGKSFEQVSNPSCRIVTSDGDELLRFMLTDAGDENGLIMSRLIRHQDDGRWCFQAIGQPCRGNTFKDSMPQVMAFADSAPLRDHRNP